MKSCPETLSLVFDSQGNPAAELLAFTLRLREYDLSRVRFWVRIPRRVFSALPEETFKEIFSDMMIDADPAIEQRMRVTVSDQEGFGLGRLRLGASD